MEPGAGAGAPHGPPPGRARPAAWQRGDCHSSNRIDTTALPFYTGRHGPGHDARGAYPRSAHPIAARSRALATCSNSAASIRVATEIRSGDERRMTDVSMTVAQRRIHGGRR